MKKFTKITLITAVCLLCVGIVFASVGRLTGATIHKALDIELWNTTFHTDRSYQNEFRSDNTYNIDPRNIENLSIDWGCGDIKIVPYDGDTIVLEEKAKGPLNEDTCLRYRINDYTLHIQNNWEPAGISFSGDSDDLEKLLTVKIPKNFIKHWLEVSIDTISSDISMEGFYVYHLDIDTTSGSFYGKDLSPCNVEMETVSGSMKVDFLNCHDSFSFESTSGSCMLGLPKDSDIVIKYDTVSGQVYNYFGKHKDGKDYDKYHGEGEFLVGPGEHNRAYFETVSGDFYIYQGSCFKK